MKVDAKTKQFTVNAVPATIITAPGDTVGIIIDTKGFQSLTFSLIEHSNTDPGFNLIIALTLEDGDDPSLLDTAEVLPTDDPKTLLEGLDFLEEVGIHRVGYIGKKRFIRATIRALLFSGSPVVIASVVAILADAQSEPTADQ